MNKLIFITLLLIVFSGKLVSGKPQRLWHSDEEKIEFIQTVKKNSIIKRSYKIETEDSFVLAPGQAAYLDFEDNSAGVKEFIFFYNDEQERVHIIYGCTDETEEGYDSTSLRPEKLKDHRGICATGAEKYLNIFSGCKFKDSKAFVKFRTTEQLSGKDQQEIKEIDKARKRRKAENTLEAVIARLRQRVSQEIPYEFGTVKEITIVPSKNAVLLKCSDNPEDVKEILIGANSKHLYIYCIRTSGSITGGGGTWKEGPGSFRQVGGSAAIGMWERKDKKINVQFQLTNDDSTMIQAYRKLEKAGKSFPKGRFSEMIKNWNVLLNDPELLFPRLTSAQRVEAFTQLWSTVKFNFANFDLVPGTQVSRRPTDFIWP